MKAEKENKSLPLKKAVEEAEKKAIDSALKTSGNNRSEASRMLGISRRALYDKIAAYGLNESDVKNNKSEKIRKQ